MIKVNSNVNSKRLLLWKITQDTMMFAFLLFSCLYLSSVSGVENSYYQVRDEDKSPMVSVAPIIDKLSHFKMQSRTTQESACVDSPLRIKFFTGGKYRTRSCSWLSQKPKRCNSIEGAFKSCPSTCNMCASCIDSPHKFKVLIKGKYRFKKCSWVKKKATKRRCESIEGIKETCRSTCQTCTASTCGNGVLDQNEECDDGLFNGEDWISECDDSCTFRADPSGCCVSDSQCFSDVKEVDCPPESFQPLGVCGEFSPSCPFNTPTESLCSTPGGCNEDSVCVSSFCNTETDSCEYSVLPGYDLVDGECVSCTLSSPPCPEGEIQFSKTCCQLCPAGTYELNGTCIDCPADTTSVEGSSGIESCSELLECPSPSNIPSTHPTILDETEYPSIPPTSNPTIQSTNGLCHDQCNILNYRLGRLNVIDVNLKDHKSLSKPEGVSAMGNSVTLLSKMSTLANIANFAEELSPDAMDAVRKASRDIIDDTDSSSLTQALVNGALAQDPLLIKKRGMSIWIKLTGTCCKRRPCCVVSSRKEWVEVEKWHKCTARPPNYQTDSPHIMYGFLPNDTRRILHSIPGCIMQASKAFTC